MTASYDINEKVNRGGSLEYASPRALKQLAPRNIDDFYSLIYSLFLFFTNNLPYIECANKHQKVPCLYERESLKPAKVRVN